MDTDNIVIVLFNRKYSVFAIDNSVPMTTVSMNMYTIIGMFHPNTTCTDANCKNMPIKNIAAEQDRLLMVGMFFFAKVS